MAKIPLGKNSLKEKKKVCLDNNLLVKWHCSQRDMNQCLLTFDNELMTEQSKDTAKIEMDEPVSFI